MFEVNNGVAKIDGASGKYNETNVTNPSVRYGRNAVSNYYSYLEQPLLTDNMATPPILDFGVNPETADKNAEKMEKYVKENNDYLNALPPLEFEYRYMPNIHKKGDIDREAVLGAAYEELGQRKEVSVKDIEKAFGMDDNFTAEPMDINKDGNIDIGEYASTIIAADMLSKNKDATDKNNIDGTINSQGFNTIMEYTKKSNADAASKTYGYIYENYNLGEAANKFKPEG